ncbi:uncharacterized protein P174DRAFT_438728 [Aspergillus novofumigatus IBT 16806]|uniref:Uncharacterized protein n=1 Tax=Aspergillus novofumigatus (strain IBT 16806) TaxID=1392255 RepID=A0A2I1CH21_ASPN1|nr:uncharacterized protein P174DRAFT_438728 [Aspergillus novofumigatus IBT 16806]PKX96923.1 hypothetical protein P174DRAFT_438728 [Aspergillus novofumigatus IBT 16806]
MVPTPSKRLINRLRLPKAPSWGFVIYRTTYSPQSYRQFPRIIELTNSCIKREILEEYACAKHHPIIIEDRTRLNGISLHGVRSHYESWIDDYAGGRGRENYNWGYSTQRHVCLVVDEEYYKKWWVKAVEPWPEIDEVEREATGFDGTMKVSVFSLFCLWTAMYDPYPMWMLRRDANGLYTG